MPKHVSFMGAFAVSALIATGVVAQDADTVVATVGDTDITLGEMIITRAQLPQQYDQFPDDVLFDGILDQLIQQQLLADTIEGTLPRVEYALRNERRSLLAGERVNNLANGAVTEEALQAAYAEMVDGAAPETEWNASHLLVETEEEAVAAKERVDGGEEFAEVAREVSTGPSGPSGGALGWFGPGMMVPAFEEAVTDMEPGDVSGPVQTQFGWHIVTLNDKRTKPQPELEAVRSELAQQLQEKAIDDAVTALREEVEITMPEDGAFDPAILSDLSLVEPE